MSVVDELEVARASGEVIAALTERAEAMLADPDVVRAATAEPGDVLAGVERAFAALETEVHGAYRRYPVTTGGASFHSAPVDTRPAALYATVSHIRDSGLYLPSDLREMLGRGDVPGEWAAVEAVRLALFLVALRALMREMDKGQLSGGAYIRAVKELGGRFGGMAVAR